MWPATDIRKTVENRLFPELKSDVAVKWRRISGGLSRAKIWRVARKKQIFAVRYEGEPALASHARWIRHTVGAAADAGLGFVAAAEIDLPEPWEAARWRPGEPLSERPDDEAALRVACDGLGRFHRHLQTATPSPRPNPDAYDLRRQRLRQIASVPSTPLDRLTFQRWPELIDLTRRLPTALEKAVELAETLPDRPATIQPIHGDARPEHFLIERGELTGLIDFAAMRVDTPLADLARFAGEIAGGDETRRQRVVSLYEEATGESIDHSIVAVLDQTAAVISASHWLGWLRDPGFLAERDPERIRERLRSITSRLLG